MKKISNNLKRTHIRTNWKYGIWKMGDCDVPSDGSYVHAESWMRSCKYITKEKETLLAFSMTYQHSVIDKLCLFIFDSAFSVFFLYETVNGNDFIMQRKQNPKNIKQQQQQKLHTSICFYSLKTGLYKHNHVQRSIAVTRNIHNSLSSCSMRSN